MVIINTYDETLAYYTGKLAHAEEELQETLRQLKQMEILAGDGWQGPAGESAMIRLQELQQELRKPVDEIDQIRRDLNRLSNVIEEEIRALAAEAAANTSAL